MSGFGTIGRDFAAVYELARLAVITRFRFKGAYWTWRRQTAFGGGGPGTGRGRHSRRELVRSVLDYGWWVHCTRRMMSSHPA